MKEEVKDWVFDFFEKIKGGIPGTTEEEKSAVDYFSAGLLDSLGVVNLIVGIEEEFQITFGPENMQDPRFCRIGGLVELISEMRQKK